MDPLVDDEEKVLRDQVIHLHSLFRHGPPNPRPTYINPNPPIPPFSNPNNHPHATILPPFFHDPNPNFITPNPPHHTPNPNFKPQTYISRSLRPANLNSKLFKKPKNKTNHKWAGGTSSGCNQVKDLVPKSGSKWPCPDDPQPELPGWPTLNLKPPPSTRVATPREQSRILATRAQQNALKAAQDLFAGNDSGDDDSDEDEEKEEDDDVMDDDAGDVFYGFFCNLFRKDWRLRSYYEKNYASGEFTCLVCAGVGQKLGKRFKDCVALVQHSVNIAKTKKRKAHRALGQAICSVLAWDINKLPTIDLPKLGDSQGNAAGGPERGQVVCNPVVVDNIDLVCNKDDCAIAFVHDTAAHMSNVVIGELMTCEHSLLVANGNNNIDDPGNGILTNANGNDERVVNCLEPYKEDGVGKTGNEVKDIHVKT